ncbi:MAG: DEAD/DEAH box helicase, partial [Spirochaetales bacterium]
MSKTRPKAHKTRTHIAPGNRVVIRDAEWLVTGTRTARNEHQVIDCLGLSEIVKDEPASFLTELEDDIQVLDPAETALVPDESSNYEKSRLYLETLFRNSAPSGDQIMVGDKGAMDVVPYQLEPAKLALRQPRVRLLIADAVGLGKTIEAGILLSELIQRGRGKRILVVAVKSMLTQFQKELWARFTIPLVRLDSEGIQRVRRHLPTNYNPFSYYDRTIISVDTLKREAEYRYWIEQSYWDVVVIDEAQNVARRGGSGAMRHRLADRLADRCDSMLMLSATPHDGKPESFASLMNMLNPTAIGNPSDYTPEDIRGLFIRRHKHDIRNQVVQKFQERSIRPLWVQATEAEERVFDSFERLDLESDREVKKNARARGGKMLFKTLVEKSLFSSIPACVDTVKNRIHRLETGSGALKAPREITALGDFLADLERVPPEQASKYTRLLSMLRGEDPEFDWKLKAAKTDRVVIFTERIRTMRWLAAQLTADLNLSEGTLLTISGEGMSDIEQQRVVEEFGKEQSRVRILVASDVASEGINLHYLSHRMIHFDIPWSLMTFQQRNGRIDRFGQERKPEIYYLLTESRNSTIRGDMRVLELLTEKDQHVHENIGDPGEFTGRHDVEEDEAATAEVIEEHVDPRVAEERLFSETDDFLASLLGEAQVDVTPSATGSAAAVRPPSVYRGDYEYYRHAIEFLAARHDLQMEPQPDGQSIVMTRPQAFTWREKFLPREVIPADSRWKLTTDRNRVQDEIAAARKS